MAWLVKHVTIDLRVESSSLMLGVESTSKKKLSPNEIVKGFKN